MIATDTCRNAFGRAPSSVRSWSYGRPSLHKCPAQRGKCGIDVALVDQSQVPDTEGCALDRSETSGHNDALSAAEIANYFARKNSELGARLGRQPLRSSVVTVAPRIGRLAEECQQ
jgi:hypothetical protein